jgi:alpha/beta superfamily hydrolase
MNSQTQRLDLQGTVGHIEALRDTPEGTSKGLAIICHPHPLFGGTMDNKVVQTIARAFVQTGWTALRFNFRGVGQSAGAYDEGHGEADDLRSLIKHFSRLFVWFFRGFAGFARGLTKPRSAKNRDGRYSRFAFFSRDHSR